jgi:hypothetical protein
MAPSPADRAAYAAGQASLLLALVRGEELPPGFDADKAAVAARSLRRKRAHAVAGAWPSLTLDLGERFAAAFDAYALTTPPPAFGDGLTDGLGFARTLGRAELTDDGRVELLYARALAGGRGAAPRRRRGIFARALWLHEPRRILIVLRAPGIGRRQVVLALGRAART